MYIMETQAHALNVQEDIIVVRDQKAVQSVEQENIVVKEHLLVVIAHQDMETVQQEVIAYQIVIKKFQEVIM